MFGAQETKDVAAFELNSSQGESYSYDGQIVTGNRQDALDMVRLGKKQEFRRNFNFISTLGFISTYMETWEFVLVSLGLGLINGGLGGLYWTFIGTITCYSTVVLSLAEMASMAPTSGGQYHWVSEFAPDSCQKFLSYSAGWMSTLGWLASTASSVFVCATAIQSVIEVQPRDADWAFLNWQFTLLMLGLLLVTIVFNTWMARLLPMLETIGLFGHLAGFIVVMVSLLVLCPKNSASDVFTTFVDSGGWGNVGVACLVAQSSILYCNLGSDSIVHIAEEVDDASLVVPKVMWWSYILNTILGIAMLIIMLFCIGPLEDALSTDSPYLELFNNTGSVGVATMLTIVVLLLIYVGNITCLATSSREVFAFARDKGFPFSRWLAKINRHNHVPYNAVYAVSVWAGVICLIDLGSTFAFNLVVSLNLLALVSTYALSIGCVTLKRLRGQDLPPARWSLGRWGLPINLFAVAYCIFVVIWSSFPAALPVSLDSANWAPAIWAGVFLLSIVAYILHGKTHYTAPVLFVEGKRVGGLQSST